MGDERIAVLGAVPERRDLWMPLARARARDDGLRALFPSAGSPTPRRCVTRMYRKVLPALLRPLDRIRSLQRAVAARASCGVLQIVGARDSRESRHSRVHRGAAARRRDRVAAHRCRIGPGGRRRAPRRPRAFRSVAAIASWDNLTNKGHMRVVPDLVTVWNEHQKQEAVEYHGVPADRVAVTGAQLFDRWFGRAPSQSREAFCQMVGLPDTRPFVLFTGSSVFIARSEVEVPFVRRWIEGLRAQQRSGASRCRRPRAAASVQRRRVGERGLQRSRVRSRSGRGSGIRRRRNRRGRRSSTPSTTARPSSASTPAP